MTYIETTTNEPDEENSEGSKIENGLSRKIQTKIVPKTSTDGDMSDSWQFRNKILNVDDDSFKPLVLSKAEEA